MKKHLGKFINFISIGDNRGTLVTIEEQNSVPFEIKRVYYLFDTKENVTRGLHAHKDLQQVLICISGSCKIKLDNGNQSETFLLNKKEQGLYIDSMIWREMSEFSPDCVLLVLASKPYDESDYIRNYDDFLKIIKNNT